MAAEVTRVVELILEHACARPDESLGVIALGIKHAERIDLALREALAGVGSGVEAFFADDVPEPFFVKNLERVLGDERDAIILSIGYGKHPDGRMRYQWGPLLRDGGERRLNVAATRAKHRLTVVSSFSSHDVDPERLTKAGARLLAEYLEYAGSGGTPLAAAGAGWRFHRLWSTNWFHDPDAEVAKLRQAYDQAVASNPRPEPGQPPEPQTAATTPEGASNMPEAAVGRLGRALAVTRFGREMGDDKHQQAEEEGRRNGQHDTGHREPGADQQADRLPAVPRGPGEP
ncbi:MAG TPA: AAA domain-containing protein [Streptosporangiaceae bacterium]